MLHGTRDKPAHEASDEEGWFARETDLEAEEPPKVRFLKDSD